MATETPKLVAMVRRPDAYQQPYDAVTIYVDPSAVIALVAEGWLPWFRAAAERGLTCSKASPRGIRRSCS